jgi:hypothetical protein
MMVRHSAARTIAGRVAAVLFAAGTALPGAAAAKTFISYFQPTPTACPVTSQTWGVSGVLPRDTCNGLENTKIPLQYYYWDGKVLQAPDGKCHMFADRWLGSTGFGNWGNSETIHAVSSSSPAIPIPQTSSLPRTWPASFPTDRNILRMIPMHRHLSRVPTFWRKIR